MSASVCSSWATASPKPRMGKPPCRFATTCTAKSIWFFRIWGCRAWEARNGASWGPLAEAENGEAALQVCDDLHGKVDLVLSDLVMPGMGGYELAGELAQRHPAVRVLFMSGYTEDSAARRDILLQGSAFLQKPFSVADLSNAVHQALAVRSAIA